MGVIVDLCDKVLRLYNFCTQDVAAGILYDDRSKDVLPQKASLKKHSMQSFLIKISSQMGVIVDFCDKGLRMYDFANAVSSVGYTIDVNDSFLLFVEMSSDVFV